MDVQVAQEMLNELGSSLESLETQQAALMQFLKDKGIVTDEELAPYLNQAGNASSVRWRAAHVRLEHLFSAAEQKEQRAAKPEERQAAATQTPNSQQKDSEEQGKGAKSGVKDSTEKAGEKEKKAESTETRPAESRNDGKAYEAESSNQRREEDAA